MSNGGSPRRRDDHGAPIQPSAPPPETIRLRTQRRDAHCQRFLPERPPAQTTLRPYLAPRLDAAFPVPAAIAVGPTLVGAGERPAPAPQPAPPMQPAPIAPPAPIAQFQVAPRAASRAALPAGALPRRPDAMDTVRQPPAIPPPLGLERWTTEPTDAERRFGSHSDPGPPAAKADKGNQDFAFHLELTDPDGAPWVLVGVADGVTESTWSSRAAHHAAAAFIEMVAQLFDDPAFPRTEASLMREDWPDTLAPRFHAILLGRMEEDRRFLWNERYVDPTFTRDVFRQRFWTGEDAFAQTAKNWLQTTLLAAALGPEGGFALLLGDGYARVDRFREGRWERKGGLDKTSMISFGIQEAAVRAGFVRIAPKGATRLGVLFTTDGISKSTHAGLVNALETAQIPVTPWQEHPLDGAELRSTEDCRRFVSLLADMGSQVDCDNMSIAFAVRPLGPGLP